MLLDGTSTSTDDSLRELLTSARSIAVVGASPRADHPAGTAIRTLLDAGFRVFPVSQRDTNIAGLRTHMSLESIAEAIDIVAVFGASIDLSSIVDDTVKICAKALWLQPDTVGHSSVAQAAAAGLTVVINRSIDRAVLDLVIGSQSAPDDKVDEASRDSFPASDPPAWSRLRPGGPRDLSTG